jgi:hypothetical protein
MSHAPEKAADRLHPTASAHVEHPPARAHLQALQQQTHEVSGLGDSQDHGSLQSDDASTLASSPARSGPHRAAGVAIDHDRAWRYPLLTAILIGADTSAKEHATV